jgi:hypothetical protein
MGIGESFVDERDGVDALQRFNLRRGGLAVSLRLCLSFGGHLNERLAIARRGGGSGWRDEDKMRKSQQPADSSYKRAATRVRTIRKGKSNHVTYDSLILSCDFAHLRHKDGLGISCIPAFFLACLPFCHAKPRVLP